MTILLMLGVLVSARMLLVFLRTSNRTLCRKLNKR